MLQITARTCECLLHVAQTPFPLCFNVPRSLGHHVDARESLLKCLSILPGYRRALDSLEQVDAVLGTTTEIPKPREVQVPVW